MPVKPVLMHDPPSCEFLERNIKAEKIAIEEYMRESSRNDDLVMKTAFHAIGVNEMEHLEMLEDIARKIGCKID